MARLALALVALVFCSDASAGEDGRIRIELATKGVSTRYYTNTAFKKATRARSARAGQQLRCDGRCVLTMQHGVSITMAKGAIVRPSSPMFVKLHNQERARRCLVVQILTGEVVVTRPKADVAPLVVLVAGQSLAFEHGEMRVRPSASGLGVLMASGRASVRLNGWKFLRSGYSYRINNNKLAESTAVVRPRWRTRDVADRPMVLVARAGGGDLGLAWGRVAGASRYVLEVSAKAGFDQVAHTLVVDAKYTTAALHLADGRKYARVFAEDAEGFRSKASATRQVGVVRVTLPPGGTLAMHRRMKLPTGAKVRFHHPEQLELRSHGKPFEEVPAELAAPRKRQAMLLRFKDDATTGTWFWFERYALNVRFAMTPAQPIWPWDDVTIRATFHTDGGVLDLSNIAPHFDVFIDGRWISTRWKRQLNGFVTKVAGRFVRGPVLMSMVATGGDGNTLGRAFLEIVGARRSVVASDRRVRHLLR